MLCRNVTYRCMVENRIVVDNVIVDHYDDQIKLDEKIHDPNAVIKSIIRWILMDKQFQVVNKENRDNNHICTLDF